MRDEVGVAEAARIVGVSVSTLKRLCDEGLIPNVRTEGKHRRFDRAEIERVGRRMLCDAGKYLTTARSGAQGRLIFMSFAGYEQGARELLRALCPAPSALASRLDDTVVPALLTLPSLVTSSEQVEWARQTIRNVLDQWAEPIALESALKAVGVSADSEHDDLASKLVEVSLRSSGISATSLGCAATADQLLALLPEPRPPIIWLCILHDQAFSNLVTLSQALRSQLGSETRLIIYSGCRSLSTHTKWNIEAFFMSLNELCEHVSAQH